MRHQSFSNYVAVKSVAEEFFFTTVVLYGHQKPHRIMPSKFQDLFIDCRFLLKFILNFGSMYLQRPTLHKLTHQYDL